ncbi:MAG: hypothetical protein HC945_00565 [Nitrosarchaeum sp.]|nr:hypothetical protein [Nitrosarchaeum sp.]
MKRAQVEIVGLLVIIILVALVFFLFITTRMNAPDPTRFKEDAQMREYARQFVITLHATSTSCGQSLGDLIQDCIEGSGRTCQGSDPCAYVDQASTNILASTLDAWGITYALNITGTPIAITHGHCTDKTPSYGEGIQKLPIFLGYQNGQALFKDEEIRLRICQ